MPLKVGPFIVTGHRSDVQKKLLPGEKEHFARTALDNEPALLPAKRNKLPIEIRRMSPWTRYPSVDAVNAEIARRPVTDSLQSLARQVRLHVAEHRRTKGEPQLVLVGEHQHGAQSAMALVLALTREFGDVAGRKTFMLEWSRQAVQRLHPPNDAGVDYVARRLRRDRPVRFLPALLANLDFLNKRMTGLYARHLRFEVKGCDALHLRAPSQEAREGAMHEALRQATAESQLTIVVVGVHHLPELHHRLAGRVNTLSMTTLIPVPRGDTDQAKRTSYALSTPDIHTLRLAEALDANYLDAVNFINHVV